MVPGDKAVFDGEMQSEPSAIRTSGGPPPAGNAEHDQEQDNVATLRTELERARHGRQLAEAEAGYLRDVLAARSEHIADLQRTVHALMPAPDRPPHQPS